MSRGRQALQRFRLPFGGRGRLRRRGGLQRKWRRLSRRWVRVVGHGVSRGGRGRLRRRGDVLGQLTDVPCRPGGERGHPVSSRAGRLRPGRGLQRHEHLVPDRSATPQHPRVSLRTARIALRRAGDMHWYDRHLSARRFSRCRLRLSCTTRLRVRPRRGVYGLVAHLPAEPVRPRRLVLHRTRLLSRTLLVRKLRRDAYGSRVLRDRVTRATPRSARRVFANSRGTSLSEPACRPTLSWCPSIAAPGAFSLRKK